MVRNLFPPRSALLLSTKVVVHSVLPVMACLLKNEPTSLRILQAKPERVEPKGNRVLIARTLESWTLDTRDGTSAKSRSDFAFSST